MQADSDGAAAPAGAAAAAATGADALTFGDMDLPDTGEEEELQQLVPAASLQGQQELPGLRGAPPGSSPSAGAGDADEEDDEDAASVASEALPASPHQLAADLGAEAAFEAPDAALEAQGELLAAQGAALGPNAAGAAHAESDGAGPEPEDELVLPEADNDEDMMGSRSAAGDEDAASQLATVASLALENLSMLSTSHSMQPDGGSAAAATAAAASPDKDRALDQSPRQPQGQGVEHGGEDAAWHSHPKHLLILTSSGKPVYTYHGDADSLASLMALTTALVSVVQAQGDAIHHLVTGGGTLVVFVMRGPLILVAASRCGEAVEVLQRQLELMYRQILLVVTTGVERILLRNPAYDVRTLLEGVGAVLTRLVDHMHRDASYLLHGLQPVALSAADHAAMHAALAEAVKSSGAYYGLLLVSGGYVVAEQRGLTANSNNKPLPPLDAYDVMLLDNFVACNSSIRLQHGEAFCPLCLPAYNPAAFLHAYIHFLTPPAATAAASQHEPTPASSDASPQHISGGGSSSGSQGQWPGVYLVLLSPTSDTFHALSSARQALEAQLGSGGQLQRLQEALAPESGAAWTRVEQLPAAAGGGPLGCTPVWHFMARMVARRQVVCARYTAPLSSEAARQQLAVSYGRLYSLVMDHPPGTRPNKLVWLSSEQYILMAVIDPEVELYVVLDPLCDKPTAQRCAEQLRKHISSPAFLHRAAQGQSA